jgi:hypothetical protein
MGFIADHDGMRLAADEPAAVVGVKMAHEGMLLALPIGQVVPAPENAFPSTVPGQTTFQGNPITTYGDWPSASWFVGQWLIYQASGHNTWVTIVNGGEGRFNIIEASARIRGGAHIFDDRVIAKHRGGTAILLPDGVSIQFDIDWGSGRVGRYQAWWSRSGDWEMIGKAWDLSLPGGQQWDWTSERTTYSLTDEEKDKREAIPTPAITLQNIPDPKSANGWLVRLSATGFNAGEMVVFWSLTTGPDLNSDWGLVDQMGADDWGRVALPFPYAAYVPVGYRIQFKATGETSGKISPSRGFG